MSSYPPPLTPDQQAHFPPLPPQFPHPKTWLDRNWKWFVPTLVLTFLCMFVGGIVAFVFSIAGLMKTSEPYKIAVQRAMDSPIVQQQLGTPLHIGRITAGTYNESGPTGSVDLSIPISGPRGSGHILVAAKKRSGRWAYETLNSTSRVASESR